MLLKRIYEEKLAQSSYLIACQHTHTGVIVDPLRDTERYLAIAAEERITITHVTETHIHADFVSGAHDLADATGARLLLSDTGGADWKYAKAMEWGAQLLTDGSSFAVGDVRIDVLHTPGHTPEHLTFLVTDTAAADSPMGALTGDFIFVADVGRPDLLERVAGVRGTKEAAARSLFESLQRFKGRPDYLQIWPGHGAGSACGKALGAVPQSTLGYERLFNWALAETDEDQFVRRALAGQSDPPAYFPLMKSINREGPPSRKPVEVPELSGKDIAEAIQEDAVVIDTRPAVDFAARHAEGTINIPHNRSFLKWAGALLPYDHDIRLIVDRGVDPTVVAGELALIGLDRVGGAFGGSMADLGFESIALRSTPQLSAAALADGGMRDGIILLDVRGADEWDEGHIPGAIHIPLVSLQSRLSELSGAGEIAVHCQGGGRSAVAASVLEKSGLSVINVVGGYREWERSGGAVERDSAPE